MKIKFRKIKIESFKNIDCLETEFGERTLVYGANETGKTTFSDAISYVLTGKNSFGDSQFEFIPIGSSGLSPRVELEIEISDKKDVKTVNLVRTYQAKKKKDGEFTGSYQTLCYVNGLKMGPKEYDKWIEEHICASEIFRLIHDVRYFTENVSTNGKERPWEAQRRLLFGICGIKPDIDMAKYKKRFNDLVEGLQQYDDVNQYLYKLKEDEKNCNREIDFLNKKINMFSGEENIILENGTINTCPMCGSKLKEEKVDLDSIFCFSLKGLKNKLNEELEKRAQTCRMVDLCNEFIEMKCKLAQKKVNEMLDGVQVEFFKKNKGDGELKSCCEIYWHDTPYKSLSYSTKFVVSMKIALAFQKFYEIEIPIICDNGESVDICESVPVQFIALIKRDEYCQKCKTYGFGRKDAEGFWVCKVCGNRHKKSLEIRTEN